MSTYYQDDDVADLTYMNFDALVMQSKDIWVVQFYKARSKCQMTLQNLSNVSFFSNAGNYSEMFVSDLRLVAYELKGIAKVGVFNCEGIQDWVEKEYGVNKFPTIKIYDGGENSRFYSGRPNAQAVIEDVRAEIKTKENPSAGIGHQSSLLLIMMMTKLILICRIVHRRINQ